MAHSYPFSISWSGSTLADPYPRDASAAAPGKAPIPVSSGGDYGGDDSRWNPEDLLGSALATCHMLTFLALCAKTRTEVLAYEDRAESVLDTVDKVTWISEIRLRPAIRVAKGTDPAKVRELFEKAHKYCFVANSIKSKVTMAPEIVEG
ncbi:MAG TPA: OsmC family protein [Holophagaceae bacterium]|nr:OsmC family protein [Holophagaceae bacterium]